MNKDSFKSLHQHLTRYLCPPGEGVFTIHTGQQQRQGLQQKLYGTLDKTDIRAKWEQSLRQLSTTNDPLLLGVCSDNGAGILRGANWGPLFLREAFYAQGRPNLLDLGDVRIIPHLLLDDYVSEHTLQRCRKSLYGQEQSSWPVAPLSITMQVLNEIYTCFPHKKIIGLGGDHSVSYSLIKPYLQAKKKINTSVAVIHFDAHTDLLSERLGVEVCFGSWAYHILPLLNDPSLLIQMGVRSSGHDKVHWENTLGVKQYWSHEINQQEHKTWLTPLIHLLQQQQISELYITVDIDVLDASQASATGTPEEGGLTSQSVISIIEELSRHFEIGGADLMEVSPFITRGNPQEPQNTLTRSIALLNCLLKCAIG